MPTIGELLQFSIDQGYPSLAYYFYYFIHENIATLDDDCSVIEGLPHDQEKVEELTRENKLHINPIHVYSLKMFPDEFCFIFARNEKEAIRHYIETHGIRPINCILMNIDKSFWIGNKLQTFRDLRKLHETFPAVAMYYKRQSSIKK